MRAERLLLIPIIIAFWMLAYAIWWASVWHVGIYSHLGADLPSETMLLLRSARADVPFFLAALFSVIAAYQVLRAGKRAVLVAAWLLCINILLGSFALFAMTSPVAPMCDYLPDWPMSFDPDVVPSESKPVDSGSSECFG